MGQVFIGTEAVASGKLTEYQLRRWYRPMFRDVYVPKHSEPSLGDRVFGAWLWSRRRAVVAGVAASALHGAAWLDHDVPIELVFKSSRKQPGLLVRNEAVAHDEITRIEGIPVTSQARTAFDLGRHLGRGEAVARLDALMRSMPYSTEEVLLLAKRYSGARGLRRLKQALPLVDGGAASPKETWLRLLLIDAGFPRPSTQILVLDGRHLVAQLDMGWEDFMVAAEYDGDYHRTNRKRYAWDIKRQRKVEGLGWIDVRVINEDRQDDIIARVDEAMNSRGFYRDRR